MFKDLFRIDNLSSMISIFIALFSALIFSYSLKFMANKKRKEDYYFYTFLTIIASFVTIFANNLIVLVIGWGFLGFTLYMLINLSEKEEASTVAKKAFILIGATDSLMLLGVGIVSHLTGSSDFFALNFEKISQNPIALNNAWAIIAFLCFVAASFAKAGAMPFHTWIPDCAETADIPVTAFLPASLDKLLGIYLLTRVWKDLFIPNQAMMLVLMLLGALTIICAVMMALVQHDLKRLLGYHAVSQVGYMVLGIGSANPLGIAGGLFHMINHAIYKSCLFLTAGAVEEKTQTSDLDKLGGLAKFMPITFICCLIASFSISGVPPFNGFASKWMIYQGLIERMAMVNSQPVILFLMLFCLLCAMFGSALTLASFFKVLHATFLGQSRLENKTLKVKEVSFWMWMPMVIMAVLCVIFGVFAYSAVLVNFIQPIFDVPFEYLGLWRPVLTTWMLVIGVAIGFIIYLIGNIARASRVDSSYVGGEVLNEKESLSGTDFYNTVKEIEILNPIYTQAEAKKFDIYEQGREFTFFIARKLQGLHSGLLPTYLIWCILGIIAIFLWLGR